MRCRILVALIYLAIFMTFAFDLLLLSFFIFIFDIEFGLQISFFFAILFEVKGKTEQEGGRKGDKEREIENK